MAYSRRATFAPLLVAAGLGMLFCGCESQRTVTTKRVNDPIIEKYASNFDTSEGVAQSSVESPYDGKEFEGASAFGAGEYATGEINPHAFEGAEKLNRTRDFKGAKDVDVRESDLEGRTSRFDDQSSQMADRQARESGRMSGASGKKNFFDKMFRTKDIAESRQDYSASVGDALDASGSTASDAPQPMSVDDVRQLLNRR